MNDYLQDSDLDTEYNIILLDLVELEDSLLDLMTHYKSGQFVEILKLKGLTQKYNRAVHQLNEQSLCNPIVTWLNHPDPDFIILLFYIPEIDANWLCKYNWGRLKRIIS